MSDVDALFRLLQAAPPRSAEIVKRLGLQGASLETIATLFGVDVPRAKVLAFRALLDVQSGGSQRLSDSDEARAIEQTFGGPGSSQAELIAQLQRNRVELEARLERAAQEYAASPDRKREDWLRYAAIVLVIALSAFFYWREQQKPKTRWEKRPVSGPQSP
ncbi:MAG TPA: hypothetical protein VGD87_16760 [Archangium sp.]